MVLSVQLWRFNNRCILAIKIDELPIFIIERSNEAAANIILLEFIYNSMEILRLNNDTRVVIRRLTESASMNVNDTIEILESIKVSFFILMIIMI